MSNLILPSSQNLVWIRRPTEITKEFSRDLLQLESVYRGVIFPHLSDIRQIYEHVFDNGMEHIVLAQEVWLYEDFQRSMLRLGWKVAEVPRQDTQERAEWYDALFRGGTMQ